MEHKRTRNDIDTTFNYSGGDYAFFSSNEAKWINLVDKLSKAHPDQVIIIKHPKENDGVIYAKLPPSLFRLKEKTVRVLTEEQRAAASERCKLMAAKRQKKEVSSDGDQSNRRVNEI